MITEISCFTHTGYKHLTPWCIFSGNTVWQCQFDNFRSVSDVTSSDSSMPWRPRAAVIVPNWGRQKRLYLFDVRIIEIIYLKYGIFMKSKDSL